MILITCIKLGAFVFLKLIFKIILDLDLLSYIDVHCNSSLTGECRYIHSNQPGQFFQLETLSLWGHLAMSEDYF